MTEVFSGIRIIELAQYVFVPAAGALLADHGAEVIHVETVDGGDPYRTLKIGDGRETGSANLSLEQNNRGKKSIAIDLKTESGREALLRLIDTADVFLTSLRPKAIKSLRLTPEDLQARNPKLIYVRGNGVGFKGNEIDKAGYDSTAFWARGGFAHVLRPREMSEPVKPRPALGDHVSAISVAYGIAGALFKRAMTGEAAVVDVSLLSTAVWSLSADVVVSQTRTPEQHAHVGDPMRAPLRYTYRTADGRFVQLMFLDPDRYWPALCNNIDRSDLLQDARFISNAGRADHGAALIAEIQATIGSRNWEDWKPIFDVWDAPWELVRTIHDVTTDPQVEANGLLFPIAVRDGTSVKLAAGPVGFDGRYAPKEPVRAPLLGEHTEELLAGAGYSREAIAELLQNSVVG
ncbi:crotonobetainyl-CoA:carnitine CoA-transferase CaiB-like acyl-CoA transferase [Novosphingobium sp. PhB165]|uniref:CaiB/BaiF CoA transferase family protein n=1 Tax=Novosphingobium sp. PhB165 TaxID=2485105 RepID=UPI0010533867|nr:CoA transferase [Novosphingobium sp. PhB165]TCM20591.1 crotonobetainyl-CoA:carnitine CoA-transferase CaiB-like acyl-CoA transferase [Novosphingobium sp. PhB165]